MEINNIINVDDEYEVKLYQDYLNSCFSIIINFTNDYLKRLLFGNNKNLIRLTNLLKELLDYYNFKINNKNSIKLTDEDFLAIQNYIKIINNKLFNYLTRIKEINDMFIEINSNNLNKINELFISGFLSSLCQKYHDLKSRSKTVSLIYEKFIDKLKGNIFNSNNKKKKIIKNLFKYYNEKFLYTPSIWGRSKQSCTVNYEYNINQNSNSENLNSLLEIINEKGEENYRRYVAESLDILLNYKNNSSVINLFKDKMLPSKLPKLNDNLPKLTTDFLKFINIICKNYNYFIIDEKKYEFKIPLVATIKSEDYIPKRISKINILLKDFFDKITKDPNFGIYYKEKIKEFCDKESCNGNKQCSVIKFINETINKGNSNNQNINKLLMVANNNKIYDQEILVKFINIKNLKNILKEKKYSKYYKSFLL